MFVSEPYLTGAVVRGTAGVMATAAGVAHGAERDVTKQSTKRETERKGHFVRMTAMTFTLKHYVKDEDKKEYRIQNF